MPLFEKSIVVARAGWKVMSLGHLRKRKCSLGVGDVYETSSLEQ